MSSRHSRLLLEFPYPGLPLDLINVRLFGRASPLEREPPIDAVYRKSELSSNALQRDGGGDLLAPERICSASYELKTVAL